MPRRKTFYGITGIPTNKRQAKSKLRSAIRSNGESGCIVAFFLMLVPIAVGGVIMVVQ